MPDEEAIKRSIQDLKKIVERDIPEDDKGVLKGVIESMEEFLEIPYESGESPFQEQRNYQEVYKKRLDRGD